MHGLLLIHFILACGSVLEPVVWCGFTIIKLRRHCEHLAQRTPQEASRLGPVLPRPAAMVPGMHLALFNLDLRLGLTRLLRMRRWLLPPAEIEITAGLLHSRL